MNNSHNYSQCSPLVYLQIGFAYLNFTTFPLSNYMHNKLKAWVYVIVCRHDNVTSHFRLYHVTALSLTRIKTDGNLEAKPDPLVVCTPGLQDQYSVWIIYVSSPSKYETLAHCWADVGPASERMAQHQPNNVPAARVYWGRSLWAWLRCRLLSHA